VTHTTIFSISLLLFDLMSLKLVALQLFVVPKMIKEPKISFGETMQDTQVKLIRFFLKKSHFFCFSSKLGGFTRAIKKKPICHDFCWKIMKKNFKRLKKFFNTTNTWFFLTGGFNTSMSYPKKIFRLISLNFFPPDAAKLRQSKKNPFVMIV